MGKKWKVGSAQTAAGGSSNVLENSNTRDHKPLNALPIPGKKKGDISSKSGYF